MNKKTSTKHALRTSILAFLLCFAMFVGTTFAWFTDSATVNVNTIQAGVLDIALEQYNEATGAWEKAELDTLSFMDTDGTAVTLWEPGASYVLPKLRVVNKGNLAAKFMIQVEGINGACALNDAITWTVAFTDANGNAGTPASLTTFCANEYNLLSGQTYEFQVKGTMNTFVGNEYQDLKIDDIAITILATQFSGVEQDIAGSSYDADAEYPAVAYVSTTNELHAALENAPNGATIYMTEGTYTTNSPFQIYGKSVNLVGLGDVTVHVTTRDTKAFYITSGVGADQVLDVSLTNIDITTQYSSNRTENSSARGSIWLRSCSEEPDEQHVGSINLTLNNTSVPSMQTDNNYDGNCVFNVKLMSSTITHWVNLEARHNSVVNHKSLALDTYTNFKYDKNSVINGMMVQSSVADAAIAHITINGVVPTEKGVVIPAN